MATTALTLITASFEVLSVFQQGESIPNKDSQSALGFLNRMTSGWAQQTLTIPAIARNIFTLTAGKGGPSNPYTIGVGGDFNVARPANQASVVDAGLILGNTSPAVEIPRAIATDSAYNKIRIKELTSTLFTAVYYNPTTANARGLIQLWPVPDTAANSLVLYLQQALSTFATLTTQYEFPPGYEEAFVYNLARRMAKPWGAVLDADTKNLADQSLTTIKRSNLKLSDLANDLVFSNPRAGYDINTNLGG